MRDISPQETNPPVPSVLAYTGRRIIIFHERVSSFESFFPCPYIQMQIWAVKFQQTIKGRVKFPPVLQVFDACMVMSINTNGVKTHTQKRERSALAFPLHSSLTGTPSATAVFPPKCLLSKYLADSPVRGCQRRIFSYASVHSNLQPDHLV